MGPVSGPVEAPLSFHVASHACYSQGCRTAECREAHRLYELDRKRQRARPDGGGKTFEWVDASEVREHLLWLATKGAGYRQVSKISGVAHRAISRIRNGKVTKIRSTTANKLLGVHSGLLMDGPRKRFPAKVPHYHLNEKAG